MFAPTKAVLYTRRLEANVGARQGFMKSNQAMREARRLSVRIVAEGSSTFPMFELAELLPEGGELLGPLLLEPREEVTLEFSLAEKKTLRVRARVVAARAEDPPRLQVLFLDLSEGARRELEAAAAITSPGA